MSYSSYDEDIALEEEQERLKQEIEKNTHLIDKNSENLEAYFNRGCAYLEQSKSEVNELLDLAILDFDKCIELNPCNADAYYRRGSAFIIKYYFREKFLNNSNFIDDKMIKDQQWKEYNDSMQSFYTRLKEYYINHPEDDDFKRAINDYEKSLILNPKLVDVYLSRGRAYYHYSINTKNIFEINLSIIDYLNAINNCVEVTLDVYLWIGLSYYQKYCITGNKNDLGLAVQYFRKILMTQFPGSLDDAPHPFISISKSEYDAILSCLSKAISFSPLRPSLYIFRGTLYMMKCSEYEVLAYMYKEDGGDYDKEYEYNVNLAIVDYNIALNLAPNNARINKLVAYLYESKYRSRCGLRHQSIDKELAGKYFSAADKIWSTTLQQASYCLENNSYLQAIKLYTKLIKYNSNDCQMFYFRACAYFNIGQYDSSIEDVNQAIEKDKMKPLYYSFRGRIWFKKEIYDKAKIDLSEAINTGSSDAADYYFLGKCFKYQENAEYEKAIESISNAIRIDPNNAMFFVGRGDCFYSFALSLEGDYSDNEEENDKESKAEKLNILGTYRNTAISDYSKALVIDSNCVRAYVMRGTIYTLQHEIEKAKFDLHKALLLAPQDSSVLRLKRMIDLSTKKST